MNTRNERFIKLLYEANFIVLKYVRGHINPRNIGLDGLLMKSVEGLKPKPPLSDFMGVYPPPAPLSI